MMKKMYEVMRVLPFLRPLICINCLHLVMNKGNNGTFTNADCLKLLTYFCCCYAPHFDYVKRFRVLIEL